MQFLHELNSPVGRLKLLSSGETLTGLYFEQHSPAPRDPTGKLDAGPFAEVVEQLEAYFAGVRSGFQLRITFEGTEFQQQVWQELRNIRPGQTMTYSDLAGACDRPKAMRAIGAAVGRNPISIVVPCHRVIGASGALTGFAGGLERKRWLLQHEGVEVSAGA